jgi:chorismate-pyruvate lyase
MPSPALLTAEQSATHREDMHQLVGRFFAELSELGTFTAVDSADLPDDYARLLAHHEHMTVSLEQFHGGTVSVHVLKECSCADFYARNSLLSRHSDGRIVQFGIMRIDLAGLRSSVREAIEAHAAPLGRILIEHGLLREVQLLALWRIEPGDVLREKLKLDKGQVIFGRTANIRVSGEPRVDLLEIVCID